MSFLSAFGCGKAPAPLINVPPDPIENTISLGGVNFRLQNGEWVVDKGEEVVRKQEMALAQMRKNLEEMVNQNEEYAKEVARLKEANLRLEHALSGKGSHGSNVDAMRQKLVDLEKENIQILLERDEYRFRNKVLLAMCVISEGDYRDLCKEAEVAPRSILQASSSTTDIMNSQTVSATNTQAVSSNTAPNTSIFSAIAGRSSMSMNGGSNVITQGFNSNSNFGSTGGHFSSTGVVGPAKTLAQ